MSRSNGHASTASYKPVYGVTGLSYHAVDVLRRSGRAMPRGGSADSQYRADRPTIIAESQRLERDNGLYRGVVNRCVDNVIGDGFGLQALTDNRGQNDRIEALWAEWCESPEVRGLFGWCEIEQLAFRRAIVDGDFGGILLDGPQIQLVESERIGGSFATVRTKANGRAVESGVVLDGVGAPTAFQVYEFSDGGTTAGNPTTIPADRFVFLANRDFPSQTRGAPVGVSAFPMFHRINDVCDSEAIAWQILARYALIINRPNAAELAYATSASDETDAERLDKRVQEFADGMIFNAEPGETIAPIGRDLPGANFPASVTMFIRLLGLPFGLPLELILLDWSKTNYSSARAALEQAYRTFRGFQHRMCRQWHDRVYRWKVDQWIAERKIRDIGTKYAHAWRLPEFPWLDQLKEMQAWGGRVDRGFSTHADALKSLGRDREVTMRARALEIEDAIQTAAALNTKYEADLKAQGSPVSWELFAGMERTATSTLAATQQQEDSGDEPQTPAE